MRALAIAWVCGFAVAAGAAPVRVAVAPLRDSGIGADEAAELERVLIDSLQSLPNFSVANLSPAGKLTGAHNGGLDPRPAARALQLGKESGAQRTLLADVARLGDGAVVYLQAIEIPSGRSLASTTASLIAARPLPPDARTALRAAVARVIDPSRYVGRVLLHLDVKGAEVQVDGRRLTDDAARPLELSVGTHALRVTHPAYHDFLRFLEVEFDKTSTLEVPLAAYPLAEGEMSEHQRRSTQPSRKLPWYRHWLALSAAGLILTGVTAGIVFAAQPGLTADRSVAFSAHAVP